MELESENCKVEIDLEEKPSRTRRRSSFFNKSKANNSDYPDVTENINDLSVNYSSGEMVDDNGKECYLLKLKQEMKDWDNFLWNMKYKYQESVKKSDKTKLIDSSCLKSLPVEERNFLNNKGAHKKLLEKTNTLIESVAINEKLKDMAIKRFNNYLIYKKMVLVKEKQKIYKKTIETPYIDANVDDMICTDPDSEPPRILFDSGIEAE